MKEQSRSAIDMDLGGQISALKSVIESNTEAMKNFSIQIQLQEKDLSGYGQGLNGIIDSYTKWSSSIQQFNPLFESSLGIFKNLPFDAIGMGISAVFTGLEFLYETFKKTDQEMLRLQTTLEESRKQWSSLGETQKSHLGSSLSQIEHTQHLRDELRLLADESGRIKKEDEGRANVIINLLNEALGTEFSIVDGIIQDYDKMNQSVDQLIQRKRVEAILDSQRPIYQDALNKQMQESIEIGKLKVEIQDKQNKMQQLENELIAQYGEDWEEEAQKANDARAKDHAGLHISIVEKEGMLKGYEEQYEEHTAAIAAFENNLRLAESENAADWMLLQYDIQATTAQTFEEKKLMRQQELESAKFEYEALLEQSKNGELNITQEQINAAKQRYDAKQQEFDQWIAQANAQGPNVQAVYGYLESVGYEALKGESEKYFGISSDEMDELIAGITSKDPEVRAKSIKTAEEMLTNLKSNDDEYSQIGSDVIDGLINGIHARSFSLDNVMTGISVGLGKIMRDVLQINSPSKVFAQIGQAIPEGLAKGIEDQSELALQSVSDLSNDLQSEFDQVDYGALTEQMQGAIHDAHLQTSASVNASVEHELLQAYRDAKEPQPLYARIEGQILNKTELDGREMAYAITPFISEEFALRSGGTL